MNNTRTGFQIEKSRGNISYQDRSFSNSDTFKRASICTINVIKLLFGRSIAHYNERTMQDLVKLIPFIFYKDLKSILKYRSISKILCDFVNNVSEYKKVLDEKKIISFSYEQLHPIITTSVNEKFNFAKQENISIKIDVPVEILETPIWMHTLPLLESISKENVKLILHIQQIPRCRMIVLPSSFNNLISLKFGEIFSENNPFYEEKGFLAKVVGGLIKDFVREKSKSGRPVETNTINYIANSNSKDSISNVLTFPKNLNALEKLEFGTIYANGKIEFPLEIPNLRKINILEISNEANFELPNCPTLETLNIEDVCYKAKVILHQELKMLKKLSIKSIQNDSKIKLPNISGNSTIYIQEIGANSLVEFPNSLENFTTLTIGAIEYNFLSLTNAINNSASVTIKSINSRYDRLRNFNYNKVIRLPLECNSLLDLIIKEIKSDSIFSLTCFTKNLTTIKIGTIENGATLEFPNILDSLKILIVEKIDWEASLNLLQSLENLESIFIGNLERSAHFKMPNSLNNLKKLTVKKMTSCTLKLPMCYSLTQIEIDEIDNYGVLKLPTSLNSLKELNLKHIGKNVIIKLPAICNNLGKLVFGPIGSNSKISLPKSFPNLTILLYDYTQDQRPFVEKLPLILLKIKIEGIEIPPKLCAIFFLIFVIWQIYL